MLRSFLRLIIATQFVRSEEHLVFVSAIFRHGMRAPESTVNGIQYDKEAFPYGLGELTENGIRRSFELGRFLNYRYVDNVFLSHHMDNSEFYIQSVDVNRCLMTAQSVAQGMFSPSGRVVPMPVPVHTRPLRSDWMLAFPWDKCDSLQREFSKYCLFPEIRMLNTFRKYQGALFDCMGAKGTFFNDTSSFSMIDTLVSHELVNAPLPNWYTPTLKSEAKAVMAKTQRFQLGLGEYHNPAILRVTIGQAFDTILKEILHKWNCQSMRDDPNCQAILPLKFKAISTQDFAMNSLLESLGVRREALGKALAPQYNSLLLFELWNVKGQPMIKVLYKRGTHTNKLVNLSGNTRSCHGVIACPLEQFAACCDDYRSSSPMEECVLHRPFPTPEPLAFPEQPIQIDGLPPAQPQQLQQPPQLLMGSLPQQQLQQNLVLEQPQMMQQQPALPSALQQVQPQPRPQLTVQQVQQLQQQLDQQLQQHLQQQQDQQLLQQQQMQ
ncbi:hypothetical protein PENTCL1PPCAC_30014, partial [Pristionchus entomophagus]